MNIIVISSLNILSITIEFCKSACKSKEALQQNDEVSYVRVYAKVKKTWQKQNTTYQAATGKGLPTQLHCW